jgi:hypothetical protein
MEPSPGICDLAREANGMPTVKKKSIELAVKNISTFGDTDIFPFPLENHWFHDHSEHIVKLIQKIDANFADELVDYPIQQVRSLTGVGYLGFRVATQIDPLWNAYLLSLVIEVGIEIEQVRIATNKQAVHAYRFSLLKEKPTLFADQFGWTSHQNNALKTAVNYKYVLATDISDFYHRIYHHRLENALHEATKNRTAANRIMEILKTLSDGKSYGLPVGGNAARMLAELLLNRTDHALTGHGIRFSRFVDDYYLFAKSKEDAQQALVLLSKYLLNEGLSVSRAKTRLMTKAEFLRSSPVANAQVAESENEAETREFLQLRLTYDPYSLTGDEDYERLTGELEKFDILGMLAREIGKSRIDEGLVRRLVKSIRFLSPAIRDQAADSIVNNFETLYPVYPVIILILKNVIQDINTSTKKNIFKKLRRLIERKSHIVAIPTNLTYTVRLLAYDESKDTDKLLIEIYQRSDVSPTLRRDIILAMARRRATYWLSDKLHQFVQVTPWEKRGLIAASYLMGDEGSHWRDNNRRKLGNIENEFRDWISEKFNGRSWEIPL